jgi:hypothetical protein
MTGIGRRAARRFARTFDALEAMFAFASCAN